MSIVPQNGQQGKVCVVCGEWKPIEGFWPKVSSRDGYEHLCKACRKPSIPLITHSIVDGIEGKTCSTCSTWKPLSNFGTDRQKSDGFACRCKACMRERTRRYWQADPQTWSERNQRSYQRHSEARRQAVHEYRQANIEQVRAYDRERGPERYRKEPHKRAAYTHARRAKVRQLEGRFTPSEWRALCAKYQNTCLCCGRREPEIKLTPDHVVPLALGGSNDIANIQPLCLECNLHKARKAIDYR